MIELLKNLKIISGNEYCKIRKMLIFETLKGMFEGCILGSIMFLLMRIIQEVFQGRTIVSFDIMCVFAIAAISVTGKIICAYRADYNKYNATYNIGAENRIFIADRLKKMNMGFFYSNRLGDISGGLTTVISEFENVGITIITTLFVGIIQTAIMAVFILPIDFISGIIILVTLLLGTLASLFFQKKEDLFTEKLQGLKLDLNAKTLEYIKGIGVIKSFNNCHNILYELDECIFKNRKGFLNVEKIVAPAALLSLGIFKLGTGVIIFVAIVRFCANKIDPFTTIMLIVASFIVFSGFEMAGSMQNVRGIAIQNLDKIIELRNLPVMSEGEIVELDNANISMKHVDFSYEGDSLFHDLNVQIPEGKTTAIIGESGSGKTTLCNLIARFWDPEKGEIFVGDRNVKEYKYDKLLSNFSFVFQDVYLFEDTIKNNIKFGNPLASEEEIVNVAKRARCHEFINKLPEGYNTLLKEGGSNLSGGERQRVSIARAMLKPSEIVILDEATSSIDPENEKQLNEALKELLEHKTVVIIAHRLETVRNADQIIVLNKGAIKNIGTHERLLSESNIYKRFVDQRKKAIEWKI